MFRVWLAALILSHGTALADVVTDLRESAGAISRADAAIEKDPKAEVNLDQPIAVLTGVIENRETPPGGIAVARYWRARAYWSLNMARQSKGQKPDAEMARKALQDFDAVIAGRLEPRGWGMSIGDSLYGAGSVALNHLEDSALAHRYWQRCSAIGHAGCMNIMAAARLTGAGGTEVDPQQSIALNRMVYDSGTDFRCAGAYSALMIAQIIHLAGLKQEVDELQWMARAHPLLAEMQKEEKIDNPCDASFFEVTEYLMRLGRGERKPELLRAALKRKEGFDLGPAIRHLLGEESREAFDRYIGTIPMKHLACNVNYFGAWHAALERDPARSARYVEAMVRLGGCEVDLALFRLRKNW